MMYVRLYICVYAPVPSWAEEVLYLWNYLCDVRKAMKCNTLKCIKKM